MDARRGEVSVVCCHVLFLRRTNSFWLLFIPASKPTHINYSTRSTTSSPQSERHLHPRYVVAPLVCTYHQQVRVLLFIIMVMMIVVYICFTNGAGESATWLINHAKCGFESTYDSTSYFRRPAYLPKWFGRRVVPIDQLQQPLLQPPEIRGTDGHYDHVAPELD